MLQINLIELKLISTLQKQVHPTFADGGRLKDALNAW
jgi:hypothetical protein